MTGWISMILQVFQIKNKKQNNYLIVQLNENPRRLDKL